MSEDSLQVAWPAVTTTGSPSDDADASRGRRAAALPPDERRAAIARATLPLLLERGLTVTTRQIAEVAGVAEGTIFRAFPDKDAVVRTAIELAFDPTPTEQALLAIDAGLPFEDQLAAAVAIIQRRLSVIWKLVSAVGEWRDMPQKPAESPILASLFARHDGLVRIEPAAAARHLRALTLAASHPALADEPLDPAEIVRLLLDGIRVRPDAQAGTADLATAAAAGITDASPSSPSSPAAPTAPEATTAASRSPRGRPC
jgi:AcrR family transcriptional regulator